ncbi:hypothetical protein CEXT_618511 [Caerostris extrusa]|uniref:Uncharacterized protein n=1 Tax=Caerostris extrusa TaxID=172846 RepID=A0AAV4XP67_CAEEX|nr:hypothetical protein CEXT_618511 [Caerostris extrusa]
MERFWANRFNVSHPDVDSGTLHEFVLKFDPSFLISNVCEGEHISISSQYKFRKSYVNKFLKCNNMVFREMNIHLSGVICGFSTSKHHRKRLGVRTPGTILTQSFSSRDPPSTFPTQCLGQSCTKEERGEDFIKFINNSAEINTEPRAALHKTSGLDSNSTQLFLGIEPSREFEL